MSEENKAIARRALEEIFSAQGDLDVADEIIAPNFVGMILQVLRTYAALKASKNSLACIVTPSLMYR